MKQLGEIKIGIVGQHDGINVGRPSVFGNYCDGDTRDELVDNYNLRIRGIVAAFRWDQSLDENEKRLLRAIVQLARRVANGENITLCCWCAPRRCHAEPLRDVILEIAKEM